MKRILVKIAVTCGIIIVGYFVFFSAVTPSINGVVIDIETKKPVENAWVIVTVNSSPSTIAGSAGNTNALTHRHLRTDKDGRFNVSMHLFPAGLLPLYFGREISNLKAIVRASDGRRAEVNLSKYLIKWVDIHKYTSEKRYGNQWGNFFEHFYNPQTSAGLGHILTKGSNRKAITRAKDYEKFIKAFICATKTRKYDDLSPIAKTYVNDYFGRIQHLMEGMGVSYHTKLEPPLACKTY